MGVTIHYRGKLRDLSRVEELEDRLVDLALELDGYARIWRSAASGESERVLRGVILDLGPGVDTVSVVVSPEGFLVPLFDLQEAEARPLSAAPWVFVKTQYGPLESHVALVHILDELRRHFFPDLEVRDEADYWETRDVARLRARKGFLNGAPDPDMSAARVARLAERVRRTLGVASEHAPVVFTPHAEGDPDREGTEEEWDAFARSHERKIAWVGRTLDEREREGVDLCEALEDAFVAAGVTDVAAVEASESDEAVASATSWDDPLDTDEPWWESEDFSLDEEDPPLLARVKALVGRLLELGRGANVREGTAVYAAGKGACELMGGAIQALTGRVDGPLGWKVVQLKRALRGAAHAKGGLFAAVASGVVARERVVPLEEELTAVERELREALGEARRGLVG